VIASERRCIYCANPAVTLERMPPREMFPNRQRPGATEYGKTWNNGTRRPDAVAAVMARMHPDHGRGSWQADEIRKLISAIGKYAPGVREEMSLPGKLAFGWARRPGSGLL
jgi:hypothetical protein